MQRRMLVTALVPRARFVRMGHGPHDVIAGFRVTDADLEARRLARFAPLHAERMGHHVRRTLALFVELHFDLGDRRVGIVRFEDQDLLVTGPLFLALR